MDFRTMREKVGRSEYATWDAFKEDLTTMFNNAMIYNAPDTVFHKEVRLAGSSKVRLTGSAQGNLALFRGEWVRQTRSGGSKGFPLLYLPISG